MPRRLAPFVVGCALALAVAGGAAAPSPRIVAVGDVHGAADALAAILQRAQLIDGARRWTGGQAILVQTGDLMDRGTAVRGVFDLLMALETQAAAAGGRVQVVMGNHEGMNLIGETRDVAPELFASFADGRSEARREEGFRAAARIARGQPIDKAAWLAAHPPGYIEYREALSPTSAYGRWLRAKPVIISIEGTVFMHGGINPEFTTDTLDGIVRRAKREITEWDDGVRWMTQHDLALPFSSLDEVLGAAQAELGRLEAKRKSDTLTDDDISAARVLVRLLNIGSSSILNPDGPLWFRGYNNWTDEEGAPRMAALLRKYNAKRFVTGHTPQPTGRIRPRFGNTLFLIDTGMLGGKFYPMGRASALEIVGENATPIYVE